MQVLTRDELEKIPLRYRLLLKILLKLPNPSVPFPIMKHFPEFEGIFWAIIVPVLYVAYISANFWLFPYLTLHFGFPLNIIIGFLIPISLFVIFIRIQIERTINWWTSIHRPAKEWDPTKRLEELIQLLAEQNKKKKA